MEKKALRQAFAEKLEQLAEKRKDLYAVTSDARGSMGLGRFFDKFPEQSVETGIAEMNSVGIASGLASCGNKVFCCGPASFLSARSLEQIKVDVAYNQSNVAVVGVSGGISYGALGYTHQSLHDIAVMRAFPGLDVIIPSDAAQMACLTERLADSSLPAYVRIGRNPVKMIYGENASFEIGQSVVLREGKDVLVIACGEMVSEAMEACEALHSSGVSAALLDMHTVKPLDTAKIACYAKTASLVVTVEEHNVYGGLGGAVSEFLSQNCPVRMKILGLPDEVPVPGSTEEVFRYYGLDGEGIAKTIMSCLSV